MSSRIVELEGRMLDFDRPMEMREVVRRLREKGVAKVRLEPGDMTRYEFWIIDDEDYWWFGPINLGIKQRWEGGGVWLSKTSETEFDHHWELEGLYMNEWAGRMLSAWMVELNKEWNDGDGEG